MKILQASNFANFRKYFLAKLERMFIVPASTFDNVKGNFPIGFKIWNTQVKEEFNEILADVYDKNCNLLDSKKKFINAKSKTINQWIKSFKHAVDNSIGQVGVARNDMQNKSLCWLAHKADRGLNIAISTLIPDVVYLAVQASIEATWLNDRDQFLYPNDSWKEDKEFQSNCLAFTLFHNQNRISSKEGTNHWIPFTEEEVDAQGDFTSHFMTDFIKGKIKTEQANDMFSGAEAESSAIEFSPEAKAVFEAGREVWRYYHNNYKSIGVYTEYNPNVSLYDIKLHFKGVRGNRMNNRSRDETFNALMDELGEKLKALGACIAEKVYEYGFLKR